MLSKLILGDPFLDVMTEILSISGSRAVSKDFTLHAFIEPGGNPWRAELQGLAEGASTKIYLNAVIK